ATPYTYQTAVDLLSLLSARVDDLGATAYSILFLLRLAFARLRFSDLGRSVGSSLGRDELRAVRWRSKGKRTPAPWAALRVSCAGFDGGERFLSLASGINPQSADAPRDWLWLSMSLVSGALECATPVRRGSYANCLMAMAVMHRLAGHAAHYTLHNPRFFRCSVAERVRKKLRDGLRPSGDYELPTVHEAATEMRARAHAA
ncbi:unnamed protein product, partial [Prorocentrum cordatum]